MDSISQQLQQGVQSFRWEKANELWGPYKEEADDTCCANTYCAASASALGVAYKLTGEFLSEVDFKISAYFPEISFLINLHSFFFFFFFFIKINSINTVVTTTNREQVILNLQKISVHAMLGTHIAVTIRMKYIR